MKLFILSCLLFASALAQTETVCASMGDACKCWGNVYMANDDGDHSPIIQSQGAVWCTQDVLGSKVPESTTCAWFGTGCPRCYCIPDSEPPMECTRTEGPKSGSSLKNRFAPWQLDLPVTTYQAAELGWASLGKDFDTNLGYMWCDKASCIGRTAVYFGKNGQISAVEVNNPKSEIDQIKYTLPYWEEKDYDSENVYLAIAFRSSGNIQTTTCGETIINDDLVLSPGGAKIKIPMTQADAQAQGYLPGSCMYGMGIHHFKASDGGPGFGDRNKLQPLVPMYRTDDQRLHAIFFTNPNGEGGYGWDQVPVTGGLPDVAMCQNWCDDNCKWNNDAWGVDVWYTQHVYFFPDNIDSEKCVIDGWETLDKILGRTCPKAAEK